MRLKCKHWGMVLICMFESARQGHATLQCPVNVAVCAARGTSHVGSTMFTNLKQLGPVQVSCRTRTTCPAGCTRKTTCSRATISMGAQGLRLGQTLVGDPWGVSLGICGDLLRGLKGAMAAWIILQMMAHTAAGHHPLRADMSSGRGGDHTGRAAKL